MYLNTLQPAPGSRKKRVRVGRGIGSGFGKTSGRGVKGAGARKSVGVRPGFEGGQMPMKIRLPKFGFWSPKKQFYTEVSLNACNRIQGDVVDMASLLEAGLINQRDKQVKIILPRVPEFTRKMDFKGVGVTRGARAAIEAAGGTIEVAEWVIEAAARREKTATKRQAKIQTLRDKVKAAGIVKPKKDKATKAAKAEKAKK